MKNYLFLLISICCVFSEARAAESVACRNNPGQGYEAVITATSAELFLNGAKIADLSFGSIEEGDQIIVVYYRQNSENGYELELTSGGIVGMTSVKVSRSGSAGLTTLAHLENCQ